MENKEQSEFNFSMTHYWQIAAICVLSSLVLFALFLVFNTPIQQSASKFAIPTHDVILTLEDNQTIEKLIQSSKIINVRDVYSDILSYYNTLFTVIIFVFTIVSILVVVHVKAVAKEDVVKEVNLYMENYTDKRSFSNKIEEILQQNTEMYDNKLNETSGAINAINSDIQELKQQLKLLDRTLEKPLNEYKVEKNVTLTELNELLKQISKHDKGQ